MPVIVGDGSGDSKMQGDGKGVSVGSTTTTGRNAGVSTATGTLVFNEDAGAVQVYTGNTDGWSNVGGGNKVAATGGDATYELGGYKYHVFTSSGSLAVSAAGDVEFLIVGGGGGAGAGQGTDYGRSGGGGGAGGLRCSFDGETPGGPSAGSEPAFTVSAGVTYPVTIGNGGTGRSGSTDGDDGTPSSFGPPSAPGRIIAGGGGGGGGGRNDPGNNGGSGGGASAQEQNGSPNTSYPGPQNLGGEGAATGSGFNPIVAGYDGGRCAAESNVGGGGGGATEAGEDGSDDGGAGTEGKGGLGMRFPTDMIPSDYGTTGPQPGRYFAQGGYASAENNGGTYAAGGGGGANPDHWTGSPTGQGTANTGGGGGGAGDGQTGASGGSGIVFIRYET